jgi:hypothetical protein
VAKQELGLTHLADALLRMSLKGHTARHVTNWAATAEAPRLQVIDAQLRSWTVIEFVFE